MSLMGEAGTAPPQIPSADSLFIEWHVCPAFNSHVICSKCEARLRTYRLLVDWIRFSRVSWFDGLPEKFKRIYERFRANPPIAVPITCKWLFPEKSYTKMVIEERLHILADCLRETEFLERDITTVINRLREEVTPRFSPTVETEIIEILSIRSRERRAGFYNRLLLAWCVRQADHETASSISGFQKDCSLLQRKGFALSEILDFTYVPRDIIEHGPDMRRYLYHLRQNLKGAVMAFSQNIAHGSDAKLIGPDGTEEEKPPSREWEKREFSSMGIDKLTAETSRQIVWSWVFIPFVKRLLPHAEGRKELRIRDLSVRSFIPDKVFKQASTLVNLRYPDLWEDNWQKVKARCLLYLQE